MVWQNEGGDLVALSSEGWLSEACGTSFVETAVRRCILVVVTSRKLILRGRVECSLRYRFVRIGSIGWFCFAP
jgi:hypothetical protein